MKNLKVNKKVLATLLLSSSLILTSCSVTKCKINESHAHYYTCEYEDDVSLSKYIPSERKKINGFKKTSDYIIITEDDKKIYNAIEKEENKNEDKPGSLLEISKNPEYIEYIKENYKNKLFYKCSMKVYHADDTYKANPVNSYMPTWDDFVFYTEDPNNENATGEKSLTYYTFYGYNIVKDENNNYTLVRSEDYDTIEDVINNCTLIGTETYNKYVTEDEKQIQEFEENKTKVKSR